MLIGADPYLRLVNDGAGPSDALVALQLSALLGGSIQSVPIEDLERALDGQPG